MPAPKPKPKEKVIATWHDAVYDSILWMFSVVLDLFFREVHPRSSWKVPRSDPILFVGAPHANQFVDPLILMRVVRMESGRRISFLIAEKSMRRRFIGGMAGSVGAVSVGRALDMTRSVPGTVYLPDPINDPTLLRGVDTNFESKEYQVGGLVVLPSVNNKAANAEILEVHGPEEIRLKKPFKGAVAMKQLTGREDISEDGEFTDVGPDARIGPAEGYPGTSFKIAPKVDQTAVYNAVFEKLITGGCIGIFPEGGSHDRTELLPLKAGVAIMALGALAQNPDCGLKVIPCGMNYFHPHKFRSRAVVEFGNPVEIPIELVELYKNGERREAIAKVLELIYDGLLTVTVTSPDYDTLMLIQAVRRLYNPKGKKLPLPMVVELNRRLVKGYQRYKDDPRIIQLKKEVISYNKNLLALGVRDHQVEYARRSIFKVIFALFYRIGKIIALSAAVLPGTFLFSPIFVAGKIISIKKSREALAASTVKIHARDVVATWKLLVAMALAPALYTIYTLLLVFWKYKNNVGGRVPEWFPLWAVFLLGYIVFPTITYASLRFGEVGMDIVKSLKPLFLCLMPSSGNALAKLQKRREKLSSEVTELINTLGPEMFPDFHSTRIIADPFEAPKPDHRRMASEDSISIDLHTATPPHDSTPGRLGLNRQTSNLPRNESFKNLGDIGIFATRPTTPNKSRSRSASHGRGFSVQGFTSLSGGGLEEVSNKIRGAMRERGARRVSESESNSATGESWEGIEAEEDQPSPEGKKGV